MSGAVLREARRAFRLLMLSGWLVFGAALAVVIKASAIASPAAATRFTPRCARSWLRCARGLLAIEVRVHGALPTGAALVVANHVSWLDAVVLGSELGTRFVAKREVGSWPLIGFLARVAGVVFVTRGERDSSQRALRAMEDSLERGMVVVLFPEGTTTSGRAPLPFRSRLFAAATDAGADIVPVALDYRASSDPGSVPFVGSDDFVTHLWRWARGERTACDVHVLPNLGSLGRSPAEVASLAHELVSGALNEATCNARDTGLSHPRHMARSGFARRQGTPPEARSIN